ncbi:MAG: Spy/CpxP family protein refolding chaperone [Chlorobiota bacterium]|jgi:hypothetical protein|nr:Spy/CpxP family protein refolding chaperone [Chlorobiota bacterium]QQS67175.1 MAG: Spy/CpxP family protein refolding chaperone [Chlorobiota bacterium]
MHNKLFTILGICLLSFGFAHVTLAQPKVASTDPDIEQQLNLSDAQKTKLKLLRLKFKAETKDINIEIARLVDEERTIKKETPTNLVALKSVLKERAEKEVELSLALSRFEEKQLAILTSDQKQLLKRLKSEKDKNQD